MTIKLDQLGKASPDSLFTLGDIYLTENLLDLAGRAVPFDAQTAFDRVRAALPADEARSLCSLARRLGFAVAI